MTSLLCEYIWTSKAGQIGRCQLSLLGTLQAFNWTGSKAVNALRSLDEKLEEAEILKKLEETPAQPEALNSDGELTSDCTQVVPRLLNNLHKL